MAGVEILVPTPAQWDEIRRVDARAFGLASQGEDDPGSGEPFELERFRIAVEGSRIVGVAGSVALTLTVPGGARLATSGVTWVGVDATRRRQGIARGLLDAVHRDSVARGEVVAALWASEAGIYGRFGYGPATRRHDVAIDRRSLRGDEVVRQVDDPVVEFADGPARDRHLAEVWETWAGERCGEVSRSAAWWRRILGRWDRRDGDASPVVTMICEGGYVAYRMVAQWDVPPGSGRPGHRLDIVEFVATSPAARRSLWSAVLGVDLVAEVTLRGLVPEDPLPWWLADSRIVATRGLVDALWLRVEDPVVAFALRRYGIEDHLVIRVGDRCFELEAGPREAACTPISVSSSTVVDLEIEPSALGAWMLGPVEPARLLAAGRIRCRDTTVRNRVAALIGGWDPPHCSTLF